MMAAPTYLVQGWQWFRFLPYPFTVFKVQELYLTMLTAQSQSEKAICTDRKQ